MPSKYKNKRVYDATYGVFDSAGEYKRFLHLKDLERRGEIQKLERQVVYELIPKCTLPRPYKEHGRMKNCEKKVEYIADFTYFKNGEFIVEDFKGQPTDTYILKRKLMLYRYGIQISEVRK